MSPAKRTQPFDDADLALMRELGIDPEEAQVHLRHLATPPPPLRLLRPCTVGDGILRVAEDERDRLIAAFERAALAGRFTSFVPASGAASRMFADLLAEPEGEAARRLLAGLDRLPFAAALRAVASARGIDLKAAAARGEVARVVAFLLDDEGLGLGGLPKGLIPFHADATGIRTAFEEHLVEAALLTVDASRHVRVHFTVAPEQRNAFEAALQASRPRIEAAIGVRLEVGFSVQSRATDTIAAELDGRPFRTDEGQLLFRPGGHGALLGNLAALGADLVFVRNIDNVLPERLRARALESRRVLGGLLVELETELRELAAAVESGDVSAANRALELLSDRFGIARAREFRASPPAERLAFAAGRLRRPIRVCGMVPNQGEPGGGPFWVDGRAGPTPQIVESAQIALDDPGQSAVVRAATHFNPVDLVCALRDHRGRQHDLAAHVDGDAVFLARKSHCGRGLLALERPGLWNGAMAGWNTAFIEVPAAAFAPVKTVLDLLRPEHQA